MLKFVPFILNALYILACWWMFLSGRFFMGIALLCLYFLVFLLYFLLYWLPGYLKAKNEHGRPVPPLTLAMGQNDTFMKGVLGKSNRKETKMRKTLSGNEDMGPGGG
ncbi:MAG: hypothetical protein JJU29_02860 [Verrucomicrobia bacterium]|nr:hypothetical protein [Verrucomicrobiota bacterium]MCH8511113.1 hypothetical protein [Kiritimatiellia bacterium]